MAARHYVLDEEGRPTQCDDLDQWSRWIEASEGERLLAFSAVNSNEVETRFTGVETPPFELEHPALWCTSVTRNHEVARGMTRYYRSQADALVGHREVSALLRDELLAT